MSNYTDKIIAEFRERLEERYPGHSEFCFAIDVFEQFLTEKLKEQEAMYEEAIGEDEEDSIDVGLGSGILEKEYARNKLRKQIRQAVKEAKGEV